jgi:hypothetical protein
VTQSPNAVELTVDQAWFIADRIGAGIFPWVLAITPPFADARERAPFDMTQRDNLTRMGMLSADGRVATAVADWVRTICYCDQWLEMRFVGPGVTEGADMLRGVIGRRGRVAVVALRSAQLVTFTSMPVDHPYALVPVVTVGLQGRRPAAFSEFALPARVGARTSSCARERKSLT